VGRAIAERHSDVLRSLLQSGAKLLFRLRHFLCDLRALAFHESLREGAPSIMGRFRIARSNTDQSRIELFCEVAGDTQSRII
jgi:hypothetical protein